MMEPRSEEEEIKELVEMEVTFAVELLERDRTFDNLADAAGALSRAANRLAPEGHTLRFER